MHVVDTHTLSIVYRLLHLAGMGILLGGALVVAIELLARHALADRRPLDDAVRYEWLFWPVLAVQVLTGTGNVGVMGSGATGAETSWGGFLAVKLLLVLAVLILSAVRTALVARLVAQPDVPLAPRGARIVGGAYVGTALGVGAVVLLAVRLAHG